MNGNGVSYRHNNHHLRHVKLLNEKQIKVAALPLNDTENKTQKLSIIGSTKLNPHRQLQQARKSLPLSSFKTVNEWKNAVAHYESLLELMSCETFRFHSTRALFYEFVNLCCAAAARGWIINI